MDQFNIAFICFGNRCELLKDKPDEVFLSFVVGFEGQANDIGLARSGDPEKHPGPRQTATFFPTRCGGACNRRSHMV